LPRAGAPSRSGPRSWPYSPTSGKGNSPKYVYRISDESPHIGGPARPTSACVPGDYMRLVLPMDGYPSRRMAARILYSGCKPIRPPKLPNKLLTLVAVGVYPATPAFRRAAPSRPRDAPRTTSCRYRGASLSASLGKVPSCSRCLPSAPLCSAPA
jgi:hypothetical protein